MNRPRAHPSSARGPFGQGLWQVQVTLPETFSSWPYWPVPSPAKVKAGAVGVDEPLDAILEIMPGFL